MTTENENEERTEDERADVVALGVTDARLAELRAEYQGLTITDGDDESYRTVSTAIKTITSLRTHVEERRLEVKRPLLRRCKILDDEARRITAELKAIEDPLVAERTRVREAKRKAKEQREREERERVEALEERVEDLKALANADDPQRPPDADPTSADLEVAYSTLRAREITREEFEEFYERAIEIRGDALAALPDRIAAAKEHEAEAQRIGEIRKRVDYIKDRRRGLRSLSEDDLRARRAELESIAITADEFVEFVDQAENERDETLEAIDNRLDAIQVERDRAELAAREQSISAREASLKAEPETESGIDVRRDGGVTETDDGPVRYSEDPFAPQRPEPKPAEASGRNLEIDIGALSAYLTRILNVIDEPPDLLTEAGREVRDTITGYCRQTITEAATKLAQLESRSEGES